MVQQFPPAEPVLALPLALKTSLVDPDEVVEVAHLATGATYRYIIEFREEFRPITGCETVARAVREERVVGGRLSAGQVFAGFDRHEWEGMRALTELRVLSFE